MSLISSPEFLINMKSVPQKGDADYDAFLQYEMEKLNYGVTINGVFIPNWLYWHLNYWKAILPDVDLRTGEVRDKIKNPSLRDNEWLIAENIERAKKEKKGIIIIGGRRIAKELLNNSKLYTPEGEIEIGNAQVGQKIYDHNGNLTTIIGVFPQGKVPIYKMTLLDGRKIFCGLEHNWYVWDKKKKVHVIKTTKDLLKDYKKNRIHNGYKDGLTHQVEETRYSIPNNKPIKYDKKNLLLEPYLLGLWLGDGSSAKPQFTNVDVEILEYIFNYAKVNNLVVKNYNNKISYSLTTGERGKQFNRKQNVLLKSLQDLNLLNNKHIPNDYLHSSYEQRLELLQGLMDTDGCCTKSGSIEFTTTTEQLSKDFYFLCRSLGINLTCRKYIPKTTYKNKLVVGKKAYRFNLFTELPVFKLNRKLENIKIGLKGKQPKINRTAIKDIKYVFDDYATCISVDNKDCLYLTDNFTVTHNTSFVASWVALHASIYHGSENVIVGNNKGDIRNITVQMDLGLNNVPKYIKYDRILNDWKNEVELGWKKSSSSGERISFSHIYIKNTEDGNSTEVLAGLKPKTLIYDEVGKAPIKEAFLAGYPAFKSPYGWRCVPILTGTGGDFTNGKDAEEMFHNPERYNLIAIQVPNENRFTGLFMPGNYSTEHSKKKTTLGEYCGKTEPSELLDIPMYVTDFEASNKTIDEELEKFRKANDNAEYLKALMYNPRHVDHCFLSNTEENPFPTEALKKHRDFILRRDFRGMNVKLSRDVDGKVIYTETFLRPVSEYPVKRDIDKNAPVVIYEKPVPNPPTFLYIAGGDPYNQDQSVNSPSLGTIYIYKRTYDPVAGTYQRRIVASYSARPERMKEWHETAEMLLELYNATCMIENIGTNFIQYMENKNKSHYLADGYNLAKEISPHSTAMIGKTKGLPATGGVQNHYKNLHLQYLTEEIIIGNTSEGEPIKILGLTRIDDPMLLTEYIEYRETEFKKGGGNKKKGNFDRYVAFGHALIYEEYLQKIAPNVRIEVPSEEKKEIKSTIHSPFLAQKSPFTSNVRSPFMLK